MDYQQAVSRILDHLEADNVEAAVMACLRIARVGKDHINAAIFMRELYPNKEEVARVLYDDMEGLKPEAQKYAYDHSLKRWLSLHDVEFDVTGGTTSDGNERTILKLAAGEIDTDIASWSEALRDFDIPAGLEAGDLVDRYDNAVKNRGQIRLRLTALRRLRARLKSRCLNYAIQIERQLALQDKNQNTLWDVQNDVNNYFKEHSIEVYRMLQKVADLAPSKGTEDGALLLTQVRRALKGAADHFFPASDTEVLCSDGNKRVLNDEKYLNRLDEYLARWSPSSTAKDLAKSEFALVSAFMRRLNDMASKGVHAQVTPGEARQGMMGLFMFLSTITQRASTPSSPNG